MKHRNLVLTHRQQSPNKVLVFLKFFCEGITPGLGPAAPSISLSWEM
jgi:hypothetical protein